MAPFIRHWEVLNSCLWIGGLNPQKYEFFCANTCLRQEKMKPPGSWLYLPDSLSRYIFSSSMSLKIAIWLQWSISTCISWPQWMITQLLVSWFVWGFCCWCFVGFFFVVVWVLFLFLLGCIHTLYKGVLHCKPFFYPSGLPLHQW